MECPRDHRELKDRKLNDLPVSKCPVCLGIWVSKQEIVSLATAKNVQSLIELIEAKNLPITSLPQGELTCPVDGTRMHFHVLNNVEMDLCPQCRGIWLDRGEFDTVAFQERYGWVENEQNNSRDNFLRLLLDTVSYPKVNSDSTVDYSDLLLTLIEQGLLRGLRRGIPGLFD